MRPYAPRLWTHTPPPVWAHSRRPYARAPYGAPIRGAHTRPAIWGAGMGPYAGGVWAHTGGGVWAHTPAPIRPGPIRGAHTRRPYAAGHTGRPYAAPIPRPCARASPVARCAAPSGCGLRLTCGTVLLVGVPAPRPGGALIGSFQAPGTPPLPPAAPAGRAGGESSRRCVGGLLVACAASSRGAPGVQHAYRHGGHVAAARAPARAHARPPAGASHWCHSRSLPSCSAAAAAAAGATTGAAAAPGAAAWGCPTADLSAMRLTRGMTTSAVSTA